MSFFGKFKTSSTTDAGKTASSTPSLRKDGNASALTPLEKLLADVSGQPIRADGSDKYFGFENYGSTCYCNSIVQCLYYSKPFREHVINFPSPTFLRQIRSKQPNDSSRSSPRLASATPYPNSTSSARKLAVPGPPGPAAVKSEDDKNSPDNRKKQALADGPVLDLQAERANDYGMDESLFTSLRDIFEAIIQNPSRIGVVSPHRFLEILRRENEMFRSAMHQDAHEFLNLLLNQVVDNVEFFAKQHPPRAALPLANGRAPEAEDRARTPTPNTAAPTMPLDTHWVHDLFEGVLTSETRCLTCENTSQRDEAFLDLSVDLDKHSSVTSCLRKFSEEEMLCERNKFHCDNCGGLQEAEKRMKIKRLPRILALHLKRFKYTEDLQRLQKLFHRVVYPFYLRLFNTTDDAADPDRLYELSSVVVHIGGGPYHGHYVSIVKTEDRGWLLFDDELVEPVSTDYVQQFFGGEPVPGAQDAKQLACAYVLFYQETTMEKMLKEQEMGGQPASAAAAVRDADAGEWRDGGTSPGTADHGTGLIHTLTNIHLPVEDEPAYAAMEPIRRASTTPNFERPLLHDPPPVPQLPPKSKKELKIEEKERKAAEKVAVREREGAHREASRKRMEAPRPMEDRIRRALQESKAPAAVDAEARGKESRSGEGHAAHGSSTGEGHGEKRRSGFSRLSRGSISLRKKSSLFDREKANGEEKNAVPALPPKEQHDLPANGHRPPPPLANGTHPPPFPAPGTLPMPSPTPGPRPTHRVVASTGHVPVAGNVVAEEKTPKRNRFSLGRKKSNLLP